MCRYRSVFFLISLLFFLTGCHHDSETSASTEARASQGEPVIRYAKGFQMYREEGFVLLNVFSHSSGLADTLQYVLVKKGDAVPEGFQPGQVIRIPIASIAVTASSHIGAIDRLEAWDALVAVGDGQQVYAPKIKEKIRHGQISEIHKGLKLNEEKVIALQPDVLMVTGGNTSDGTAYASLRRAGIPVIENSEWLETSPLGRAEWIKLMAALLDRLNMAEHQFAQVEHQYQALQEKVNKQVKNKPGVLLGNEYQGTWYMPGGRSFMAEMLADAGADYYWKDNTQTGAIPLNFEAVYPVALEADFWLNITDPARNSGKNDLLSANERYAEFKSVKNDQLYSFTQRVDENLANDYFESAVYRPDLLLADYVRILHPELLPDHALYYCKKLE